MGSQFIIRGLLAVSGLALAPMLAAQNSDIPRTPGGHPDLSGTYDVSTRTPLQRATELGDRRYFSNDEAALIAAEDAEQKAERQRGSDPNRSAPPQGGDGSTGASGNVGGYNTFWIDNGTDAFQIGGRYPTSIIFDPPDGRLPSVTDTVRAERRARLSAGEAAVRREGGQNDGTAYWLNLGLDAPGPYDNMEQRPFAERCLLSFGFHRRPADAAGLV